MIYIWIMTFPISKHHIVEGSLHLLFWLFIFSAVNVNWQQNWFDPSLRPNMPAPLSVILFPMMFYAHAYWAMPRFFDDTRKWILYGVSLLLIFAAPEMVRSIIYSISFEQPLTEQIIGSDSLIFGQPSVAWLAFMFSFLYRLVVDRVFSGTPIKSAFKTSGSSNAARSSLSNGESKQIVEALSRTMSDGQLFLQQDLNLRSLSKELNISDKKLSTLLNQHLKTSFTDYVNGFRVQHFVDSAEAGKLQQLSITGLANKSGFSSKTTFYRAFKKIKGCTPTDYLNSKE